MRVLMLVLGLVVVSAPAQAETLHYTAYRLEANGGRRLLTEGTREYSPTKDIDVTGGSGHWSKALLLFDAYELAADVYREPTIDGFGLVLREKGNPNGFSWEWFNLEKDDIFLKLQGPGRLRVTLASGLGYHEIAAIEFLDDISLRFLDDLCSHPPGEHTHEFVVRKGSVLRVAP